MIKVKIYLDANFLCHISDTGGLTAGETTAFDGKCRQYIEGYRFVPAGESWTREDGAVFHGEMVAPWRDYAILAELQAAYEEAMAKTADMQAALDAIYSGEVTA